MAQTTRPSAPLGVPGEPLAPGETRTYNWKITKKQGPTDSEFDCKTWAYYSTVDKVCIDIDVCVCANINEPVLSFVFFLPCPSVLVLI